MKRLNSTIWRKSLLIFIFVTVFVTLFSATAFAAGEANVANAVNNAYNSYLKPQIKLIVNITVFGLADAVLGILFVIKLATAVAEYKRNGGRIEWIEPAGLGAGLILAVSAPFWAWSAIGW